MIVQRVANRLRQARKEVGWTQGEAAHRLGIRREYLNQLENARHPVPLRLLRRIAELYGYPLNWFYGVGEPTGSFQLLLRASEESGLSHETRSALRKFVDLCEEIANLREMLGERFTAPPTYPIGSDREAEQMALAERARLGISGICGRQLPEALEAHGIAVIPLPMPQEVSGAMAYDSEKGAYILVNANDFPPRQLWTIAHEYGHLLAERDRGYRLPELVSEQNPRPKNGVSERFANRFATHLLLPEEQVRRWFPEKSVSIWEIVEARRAFGVSYPALLNRLQELGYLSKRENEALQGLNLNQVERAILGSEFEARHHPIQTSRTLRSLVLRAVSEGEISLSYAGELLEISPMEIQDIVADMEVLIDAGSLKSVHR